MFLGTKRKLGPDFRGELARRMVGPQRHRLLQGYPMVPLMSPADPRDAEARFSGLDPERPLIVGVIPHPFCNPAVRGCGFCTFPHEPYRRSEVGLVVDAVTREIDATLGLGPELAARQVAAVYLGGATASLTPTGDLERLGGKLATTFDLSRAEITLEGVPISFLRRDCLLLRVLEEVFSGARHLRLSMGVQTFDPTWLELMGRRAFGRREHVARSVEEAQGLGMTVSADLLINLPGQRLEAVLDDVDLASALGFDQICLYHLVLFPGLGTVWSADPSMVAALPDLDSAFAVWREARAHLLTRGFVQTTLTNFERRAVNESPRRFIYEECSYHPELYDGLGFGPSAISCFTHGSGRGARKWINATTAAAYRDAVAASGHEPALEHVYDMTDLKLLHLTRTIPRLAVDCAVYRERFGTDLAEDFPGEVEALVEAQLVDLTLDSLALTERGMFYADSVAGLLAWRRARALGRSRSRGPLRSELLDRPHESAYSAMG